MTGNAIEKIDLEAEERALTLIERRSKMLARTGLVPKRFQNKPDEIAVVGLALHDLGISLSPNSLKEVYVIDGSPNYTAQMQIALCAREGHHLELPEKECDTESAVAYIRRRGEEKAHAFRYTIDMAKSRRHLDTWVESWRENSNGRKWKEAYWVTVQTEPNPDPPPEWAQELIAKGEIKRKAPWHEAPDGMLMCRAATLAIGKVCPDVLLAMGASIVDDTPAWGEVIDEPMPPEGVDSGTGEITDLEVIDDVQPEAQTYDEHVPSGRVEDPPNPPGEAESVPAEAPSTPPAGGSADANPTKESQYARATHVLAHELGLSDEALDEILHDVTGDVSANAVTRDSWSAVVARMRQAAGLEAA